MITIGVLLWLLVFILTAFLIAIEWQKWRINKQLYGFKSLLDFPIIGSGILIFGKNQKETTEFIDNFILNPYEPKLPFRSWIGWELFVAISDPDDLKTVLNANCCIDKPFQFKTIGFEHTIGLVNSATWKHDRRTLNGTFNNAILMSFLPEINAQAATLCDRLDTSSNIDDEFKDLFVTCLVNNVIRTTFDIDYEATADEAKIALDRIIVVERCMKMRSQSFLLQSELIYRLSSTCKKEAIATKEYKQFINKLLDNTNKKLNDSLAMGVDILEQRKERNILTFLQKLLLLKRDGVVDEEYIINDLLFLFFASIVTTTTAILSNLLLLAMHPDYQDKLMEEIEMNVGTGDTPITADTLNKLPLIDMFIKETLRLLPPVCSF